MRPLTPGAAGSGRESRTAWPWALTVHLRATMRPQSRTGALIRRTARSISVAIINPVTGDVTYTAFHDSFDAGIVNFPDTWNVDTSVPGQVTLHAPEHYLKSGMMEATGSPSTGHGYGVYTVNAMMTGNAQGPAIMLWPGDDQW